MKKIAIILALSGMLAAVSSHALDVKTSTLHVTNIDCDAVNVDVNPISYGMNTTNCKATLTSGLAILPKADPKKGPYTATYQLYTTCQWKYAVGIAALPGSAGKCAFKANKTSDVFYARFEKNFIGICGCYPGK